MGTVGRLDSFFQNIIDATMYQERQPLQRLTLQKDNLNVQKKLYDGLQTRLQELQDLTQALVSTDAFYSFKEGRSSSITPFGDKAVFGASASSTTATGDYAIHVGNLATAHRARGFQKANVDLALGVSGTFILGGEANTAVSAGTSTTTTVAGLTSDGTVVTGQKQLGSGAYSVQVRNDASAGWQFRLVDDSGQAVSIQSGNDATTFSSSWQSVSGGAYDTGRGLKIDLSGALQEGAAALTWQSKGVSITASSSDSLNAIANKINSAAYAEGDGVSATIVDRRLVLSARSTGTSHTMKANDVVGNDALVQLGIKTAGGLFMDETAAANASLTVNGISLSRSKNSGLTDVISGVTLSLTGKHTGADDLDTLSVASNMDGPKSSIDNFVTKFNEVLNFLGENTSVTKIADNQYTRGGLADDTIFTDLRSQLLTAFSAQYTTSGTYKGMYEIGLGFDNSLNANISDSTKLENALNNNLDGTKALLDKVMSAVDEQLGRFTGTSGYINSAMRGFDNQLTQIASDSKEMNSRLDAKQASLVTQYAEMQSQLLSLQYMQQTWSSIYGGSARSY